MRARIDIHSAVSKQSGMKEVVRHMLLLFKGVKL